jgi:hypothetical protein
LAAAARIALAYAGGRDEHAGVEWVVGRSLIECFRELVRDAMRAQAVQASEAAEHYLVGLLERFARPEPGWNARPLGLEYLAAFEQPRPRRRATLQQVGDTSLFLSGLFIEHLERQIVSTEYYMALGRVAYRQLAHLGPRDTAVRGDVFAEIAARFPDFVRVLAEISFETLFRGETHIVRVYTRWLRTRGRQDAEWLLRRGIVPVDPGVRSRH